MELWGTEVQEFVSSYEWANYNSLYGVMRERTIRVCVELLVSELQECVWSYEWAKYKSLCEVMSELTLIGFYGVRVSEV